MKIRHLLVPVGIIMVTGCVVEDRRSPDVVTVPASPPPTVVRERGPNVTVVPPPTQTRTETHIERREVERPPLDPVDPPPTTTTTTTTTGG